AVFPRTLRLQAGHVPERRAHRRPDDLPALLSGYARAFHRHRRRRAAPRTGARRLTGVPMESERNRGWRALLTHPVIYEATQTAVGARRWLRTFVRESVQPKPGDRILDI